MGYEKRNVAAGTICHVMNRGVDKRNIFMQQEDYFRFIHDLFEFNDTAPANNLTYFFSKSSKDIAKPYIDKKPRKLLVEILAFCLMPNHYHLLLKPRFDDGIAKFMKKLNMGYAKYFNEKYRRSGALFQGRYKSVTVSNEAHFIYLPYYIHLNPLDHMRSIMKIAKLRKILFCSDSCHHNYFILAKLFCYFLSFCH